ncbi:MAG: BACON domain-containing protein, partial [Mangrovibacterium sp.]
EGKDDGIFKFTVKENTTPYARNTNYAFIANGEEQPVLFSIAQEAAMPYFTITDTLGTEMLEWNIVGRANQITLMTASNVEKTYAIDADADWLTVVEETASYLLLEASENPSETDARTAKIQFTVADFPELSQTVVVNQASFAPAISLLGVNDLNEYDLETAGGTIVLPIDCNVEWNYTFADNDWITVQAVSESSITIAVDANTSGVQRSVKLKLGFDDYNGGEEITFIQYAGVNLVVENFDYTADIVYTSNLASEAIYCYNTGPRFEFWEEGVATSGAVDYNALPWTTPLSNDTYRLYAMNGYVKLGVTNVCTEMTFKKIAELAGLGEVKLKVSFKAVAYVTASGNQNDNRVVKIEARNAGVPSTDVFDINNYAEKGSHTVDTGYNVVWDDDRTFSFIISKATSETEINFLAGEALGTSPTNRICFDDIVISF